MAFILNWHHSEPLCRGEGVERVGQEREGWGKAVLLGIVIITAIINNNKPPLSSLSHPKHPEEKDAKAR